MTELRAILGRRPGTTEASVRGELRRAVGDALALDRALASGAVVRRGDGLYLRESAPPYCRICGGDGYVAAGRCPGCDGSGDDAP